MRGLGRRRISDGPRGGGPRSGTAAALVGSTRPSDPMRIGRRSFIRRAVPRAMDIDSRSIPTPDFEIISSRINS